MAWRGLSPAEKNISEIVEQIRQLGFGRSLALGVVTVPGGIIGTFNNLVGGSDYTNGTYNTMPLLGGTGTGAVARITVAGNVVTAVAFAGTGFNRGINYTVGDILTATVPGFGSGIRHIDITLPGSGFIDGFYPGEEADDGSGTGCFCDVTIAGGAFTSIVVQSPGSGYTLGNSVQFPGIPTGGGSGDFLVIDQATGDGFSIRVNTLNASGSLVTIPAPNVSAETSVIWYTPMTAGAAAMVPPPWTGRSDTRNGEFDMNVGSTSGVATFGWIAFG